MVKQRMKSAKTGTVKKPPAPAGRTRLLSFGKLLKTEREKSVPSQHEAARLLTEAGHQATQSLIAQLETGRISNPDAALLQKLSKIYNTPYSTLINCLVLDKYGVSDDATSKLCEDLIGDLVAPVATDNLTDHRNRSKAAFFQHADVLDVKGMAEWQKSFPNLKDYWVIAPDFVDDHVEEIKQAVIANLKRGANITYFVKKGEDTSGRFYRFKRRLEASLEKTPGMKEIRAVGVSEDHLRWLVADMVVANPDGDDVEGYLVVRSKGSPAFGLCMAKVDVIKTVDLIYHEAKRLLDDNVISMDPPKPVPVAAAPRRGRSASS
jgi:transcriptional regulator with XRE-family HTH domain